jgi:pilus assembly protein CpaB
MNAREVAVGGQRNLIVLVAALVMGALAVYLANAYFSGVDKRNEKIAEQLNLNTVVAARVPLNYGDTLTADKLKVVQWPASSMPEGTFSDIRKLIADPAGPRVALRPIAAGVPVLQPMLTGPGGRAVISATLPKDKRAVAIRVNDVAGVAGFVLPGDSVDVMLTRQPVVASGGQAEQVTDTIVENVRVIAADQNANDTSKDPQLSKTVTLEVDPVQAQKLALAGQVGTLSLALRNAANREFADARTVSVNDLSSSGYPFYGMPRMGAVPVVYRQPMRPRFPVARQASALNVTVGKGLKVSKVEVARHVGF